MKAVNRWLMWCFVDLKRVNFYDVVAAEVSRFKHENLSFDKIKERDLKKASFLSKDRRHLWGKTLAVCQVVSVIKSTFSSLYAFLSFWRDAQPTPPHTPFA